MSHLSRKGPSFLSRRHFCTCLFVVVFGCSEPNSLEVPATSSTVQSTSDLGNPTSDPQSVTTPPQAGDVTPPAPTFPPLPPLRTPAEDPNITLVGPKIGAARRVLPSDVSCETFSPNGTKVVYYDQHQVCMLSLDQPDDASTTLMIFAFQPRDIRVATDELDLIVEEVESEGTAADSKGAVRIWWVDRVEEGKPKSKQLLQGPEQNLTLSDVPVSPDLRFVAIEERVPHGDGALTNTTKLRILDRLEVLTATIDMPGVELSVVGWRKTDAGWRANVVLRSRNKEEKDEWESYIVDPISPDLETAEFPEPREELASSVSPDGASVVHVHPKELVVTTIAHGLEHRFAIHADDIPFVNKKCVEWVSPRYLRFNGSRLALIDVTTMQMSFPISENGWGVRASTCKFSSDFQWAMFRPETEASDDRGVYVAPVVLPREIPELQDKSRSNE